MTIILRMRRDILMAMREDLRRPHAFAAERVGFVCCNQSSTPHGQLLLAYKYVPIRDDQYIDDATVGARFDGSAIREGMQLALSEPAAMLHVHLHDHPGRPRMSRTDAREMQALMPCFVNLCPDRLHGALVLSADGATAKVWGTTVPATGAIVNKITAVGTRIDQL